MGILNDDWFLDARLKLRHFQLFLAIEEQRNLHRAACQLNISQPAASKLLSDLEANLGVRLFDRQPRGLTPNWYGEVMIRQAHSVLSAMRHTGEELTALRNGQQGTVAIGTVMAPAVTLLTSAIEQVHRDRPALKISVEVDVSKALVPRLLDGELDFAITRIPAGHDIEHFVFEEIGEEELCFVCRQGHPLAGKSAPMLADMAAYPWSLQPPGALMRQRVDSLFLHHQVAPPRQVVDTTDLLVSLSLVLKSDTITVATRETADLLCPPERFHRLPFVETLSVQPYGLVSLRQQRLSPGAAVLMSTLRTLISQDIPQQDAYSIKGSTAWR